MGSDGLILRTSRNNIVKTTKTYKQLQIQIQQAKFDEIFIGPNDSYFMLN